MRRTIDLPINRLRLAKFGQIDLESSYYQRAGTIKLLLTEWIYRVDAGFQDEKVRSTATERQNSTNRKTLFWTE